MKTVGSIDLCVVSMLESYLYLLSICENGTFVCISIQLTHKLNRFTHYKYGVQGLVYMTEPFLYVVFVTPTITPGLDAKLQGILVKGAKIGASYLVIVRGIPIFIHVFRDDLRARSSWSTS